MHTKEFLIINSTSLTVNLDSYISEYIDENPEFYANFKKI